LQLEGVQNEIPTASVTRVIVKRIGFAVLGGLATVSLFTLLAAEAEDRGLARLHGFGIFEWVVPVLLGASVGVAAWLVLRSLPPERDVPELSEEACPACGRLILDDWRLCPHCGTLLEQGLQQSPTSDRP
jgi:hypothetical protein